MISFEGDSVDSLQKAFQEEAVDDYLDFCKKLGREPEYAKTRAKQLI